MDLKTQVKNESYKNLSIIYSTENTMTLRAISVLDSSGPKGPVEKT